MPILFAFREDRFGFRFELGERTVLGRSPECELILFDRGTSRRHAEILQTEEGWLLRDLGSTNGTLFNSVRLEGETPLKRNDEIRLGQEIFLFDPDLDVAVGREGAVLMVGEVETEPEGMIVGLPEPDLAILDRSALAPLFQVAMAMASRPGKGRVLKQAAYAVSKVFAADSMALLWPESAEAQHLSALLARPEGRRLVLPRPMTRRVLEERDALIWPYALANLDFANGERYLEAPPNSVMCVPLKAHGDLRGLLYVESSTRKYNAKDLNFLTGLANLISSALLNAALIGQLEFQMALEEEELSAGGDFIGEEPETKALLGTAYQVGQTGARIMLTGEVGTGKEVLARRIHSQSPRKRGPFISINCATITPGLIERLLFGQEGGTVSEEDNPGLLEKADGGAIFIRHVDHLSLAAQVELLRTIEEGLVYRVGSTTPRPSNFRTISSSSVDLWAMVQEGQFREDLFLRLSEVTLTMPPLREIKGDIPRLARHFLSKAAKERGLSVTEMDTASLDCLRAYPWPGNVGELKNLCERLVMFARGERIVLEDLPLDLRLAPNAFQSSDGDQDVADVEKLFIRRALARSNGALPMAAGILGIGEGLLEELVTRYNIDKGWG